MTETLERPDTSTEPHDRAAAWFGAFEQALTDHDVDRAAAMFAATSFWRDLVAFSWNLTTVEDLRASPGSSGRPSTTPPRAVSRSRARPRRSTA